MQWRIGASGEIHDGGPAEITEDGTYTLETWAVDKAGNESTPGARPSKSTSPRR